MESDLPSSADRRTHSGQRVLSDRQLPSRRATLAAWLFGLLLFTAVVGVIVHLSELETLGRLLRHLHVRWLLAAFAFQALTYACAAGVWRIALTREGWPCPLRTLASTALAMLFANQAFPSAGISGSLVVVGTLRRRRVPANAVMGALLVGLVTTYAAYLIAVFISLVVLRVYHAVDLTLLLVTGGFAVIAVGVPAAVIWSRDLITPRVRLALVRLPAIGALIEAIGASPTGLLRDRLLLRRAVVLQFSEILLDAATLFVMLAAVGTSVAPTAVFGSFVMASAVSSVVPVPLGLGTFEAALVAMLGVVGVSIEAALTATLLLRGFTLWLPMAPGLWFARQELWARPSGRGAD